MDDINKLIEIGRRKILFDKSNSWSNGANTYLTEIIKEIKEVEEELKLDRLCYLEDELGDVLWDYINILLNLESERKVNIDFVIARACNKYNERVSGIEKGISWKQIKDQQKIELDDENNIYIKKK